MCWFVLANSLDSFIKRGRENIDFAPEKQHKQQQKRKAWE